MNDDNVIIWHIKETPPKCYGSKRSNIVLNENCDKVTYNYARNRWEKPVKLLKFIKTKPPRGWTYQPTYRGE